MTSSTVPGPAPTAAPGGPDPDEGADGTDGGTDGGTGAAGTRGRRLWPRVVAVVLALVVLAAAGTVAGVAWVFSGLALSVDRGGSPPVSVLAGVGEDGDADGTVVLPDTPGTATGGLHGIRWQEGEEQGWGVTGDVLEQADGRVVREWEDRQGVLPEAGATGQVDQDVFLGDPGTVGLAFEEVVLDGELGELPAYRVPAAVPSTPQQQASAGTWVVFAHGRGGQREEANRYLPLWHELGYEVLVPSYRNDVGAPQDPSGRYGLGLTEWRDIDTAVAWALDQGAERVVLAGWSMGGAIQLQVMARSEHADAVVGLVLDAPVVDWRDTLRAQGDLAGLPPWLTALALRFVELRGDLDLDELDWTGRDDAEEVLDVPVYLVHSQDDAFVRYGPSRELVEQLGDRATGRFDGPGDHTREWNVDPDGYDADMRSWLTETLPTG